jgi:ribosomal protein L37E
MEENKAENLGKGISTDFICPRCGNKMTGDMLTACCSECGYRLLCPSCGE